MLSNRAVKSQIEGVTSESDQQAFIDAGLDNRIQKRDKDQTIRSWPLWPSFIASCF
jgi:hypothetical protein